MRGDYILHHTMFRRISTTLVRHSRMYYRDCQYDMIHRPLLAPFTASILTGTFFTYLLLTRQRLYYESLYLKLVEIDDTVKRMDRAKRE